MKKLLFLCTGNSCRSQMAEGFAKKFFGNSFEVFSAGIESHGLNPYAVRVMKDNGIDISGQKSKKLSELKDIVFDYVITVCDNARETCPFLSARTKNIHKSFPDPPALAANERTEEEKLKHYSSVRDMIRFYIENELNDLLNN